MTLHQRTMLLLIWYSLATFAISQSHGKYMSTGPGRNQLQNDIRVHLPTSMTNEGQVGELNDEIGMLVNNSTSYGTECPTGAAQLPASAPVYARSNCPWYYVIQNIPDRFPTSLPVAIGKCDRQCLGLHMDIMDDFTCAYVYQNVTVLMKEYHNNILHYVEKVERLAIGSTCVRKIEI